MDENKIFYRYSAYPDEWNVDINLLKLYAVKETEKWYRVDTSDFLIPWKKLRWLPKKDRCNRQYAWDTKDKAMAHLKRRLKKRIEWYDIWKDFCISALDDIEDYVL